MYFQGLSSFKFDFSEGDESFCSFNCPKPGYGKRPASCSMRTTGAFPKCRVGNWGEELTARLHLLSRFKNKWSYTSTTPYAFMACTTSPVPHSRKDVKQKDPKWEPQWWHAATKIQPSPLQDRPQFGSRHLCWHMTSFSHVLRNSVTISTPTAGATYIFWE